MPFINDEIANAAKGGTQPTRKEQVKAAADLARRASVQAPLQVIQIMNEGFDAVWNSRYTPQEVVADLGTAASDIFNKHKDLATFLATNLPAVAPMLKQVPAGYVVTHNLDGTVTITDPA